METLTGIPTQSKHFIKNKNFVVINIIEVKSLHGEICGKVIKWGWTVIYHDYLFARHNLFWERETYPLPVRFFHFRRKIILDALPLIIALTKAEVWKWKDCTYTHTHTRKYRQIAREIEKLSNVWFSSFSATSNISSVTNTLGLSVFNFSCHFLPAYSRARTHTHAVYHDVLGFHAYLIALAVWQIAHHSFHYLWPSEATPTADNRERERLPERKGRENRQRDNRKDQGESERKCFRRESWCSLGDKCFSEAWWGGDGWG